MDNKVYIITHKVVDLPSLKGYSPLAVGAKDKKFPKEYIRDDDGINISDRNNAYCELTGLYWMWKNDKSKHIGLVHYRRYFVKIKNTFKVKGRYVFFSKNKKYSILTIEQLEKLIDGFDLLVKLSPEKPESNYVHFKNYLGDTIWGELETSINTIFPEYSEQFYKLGNKKTHLNCNMFYGDKRYIDEYSEWLFKILFEVDHIHESKFGEKYHSREMGYLSEYLFQVWLDQNNVKYKVVPVVNTGDKYAMDGVLNFCELIWFLISKTFNHTIKGKKNAN